MKISPTILVITLVMGMLGGCAGKAARTTTRLETSLEEAAEAHWMAFRWGKYAEAGAFAEDPVAWQSFEDSLLAQEAYFEIAHVEVTRVVVRLPDENAKKDPSTGQVFVRIELTTLPSQRLEKPSIIQEWEMAKEGWVMKLKGDEAAVFLP